MRISINKKIGDDHMYCKTHPGESAVNTCNICGDWLCDECTTNIQGRLFCRACLASYAKDGEAPTRPGGPPPSAPSKINSGVLFLFSLLPGANYMYMGLMKRGLATMTGFFLIIFMLSTVSMPLTLLLALSIPVVFFASFFDGYKVRRRLMAGEVVEDNVGDALNIIIHNKFLRTLVLVVLAVVLIVNVVGFAVGLLSRVLPLLAIGLIVYVIMKRKSSGGRSE